MHGNTLGLIQYKNAILPLEKNPIEEIKRPHDRLISILSHTCKMACWYRTRTQFLTKDRFQDLFSLQWRHNGRDSVSNHQPYHCLLSRLFRRRSKKTSKLRVTGLCAGNSPVTGEFPAQLASKGENVSIWWRHHVCAARGVRSEDSGLYINDNPWKTRVVMMPTLSSCQRSNVFRGCPGGDLFRHTSKKSKVLQRTHDVLRQNDVAMSFWRNNDVIIASRVRWDA